MSTTTLRQVLDHFERGQGAVSLPQLARTLGIERGMLQTMLEYWVRKGKIREISAPACTTCGSASGCPFVVTLPRQYELVSGSEPEIPPDQSPACGCGGCH